MFCSSVNFSKWPQQTGYRLQTHSCSVCAWLPNALFWVIHSSTNKSWRKEKVYCAVPTWHVSRLKSFTKRMRSEGGMWCLWYATKQKSLIPKLTQTIFRSVMLVYSTGHQPAYSKLIHSVVRHIPAGVSTIAHSAPRNHPTADWWHSNSPTTFSRHITLHIYFCCYFLGVHNHRVLRLQGRDIASVMEKLGCLNENEIQWTTKQNLFSNNISWWTVNSSIICLCLLFTHAAMRVLPCRRWALRQSRQGPSGHKARHSGGWHTVLDKLLTKPIASLISVTLG